MFETGEGPRQEAFPFWQTQFYKLFLSWEPGRLVPMSIHPLRFLSVV